MANSVLMRFIEPSIGPREHNTVGSERDLPRDKAIRLFRVGQAIPVKKEDEKQLTEDAAKDTSLVGVYESHSKPKPDHGPVCNCRFCG